MDKNEKNKIFVISNDVKEIADKVNFPDCVYYMRDKVIIPEDIIEVIISDSVTDIGDNAFNSCTSLTSITIPDSITSIGDCVFNNCTSLKEINVDKNNKNYSSENGVLFNKDKTTLIKYPEGKTDTEYSIPNSVTSIEDGAFSNCTSLKEVTIPDSVTSIGYEAFAGCTANVNHNIKPMTPMTPEEFKAQMLEVSSDGDEEEAHIKMDSIMCCLLESLGYGDGVEVFDRTEKWYC